MTPRRTFFALLAWVALAASGCGDVLSGVGDLSRDVVHGNSTTSTTTTTLLQPGGGMALTSISDDVVWVNDQFRVAADATPDDVVAAVWQRGDGVNPYVQAGRAEIAAALPGVYFPDVIPEKVTYISSQLVFDRQTGTLDPANAAAFGLWSAEPYTVPRLEGQLVVLRIGLASAFPAQEEGQIASFQASDGREMAWSAGDFVYDLFCRTGISEESCFAMANSMTRLDLLLPAPTG
jgi:hypothetical protein